MQVGDQVKIKNGPHGGMIGTIVDIRTKVTRRGKFKHEPIAVPVARIVTHLGRYMKEVVPNLRTYRSEWL